MPHAANLAASLRVGAAARLWPLVVVLTLAGCTVGATAPDAAVPCSTCAPCPAEIAPADSPASEAPSVEIVDWAWHFTGGEDYFVVGGIVQNNSDATMAFLEFSVTTHDAEGHFLTTESRHIDLSYLPAGTTSTFRLMGQTPEGMADLRIANWDWSWAE